MNPETLGVSIDELEKRQEKQMTATNPRCLEGSWGCWPQLWDVIALLRVKLAIIFDSCFFGSGIGAELRSFWNVLAGHRRAIDWEKDCVPWDPRAAWDNSKKGSYLIHGLELSQDIRQLVRENGPEPYTWWHICNPNTLERGKRRFKFKASVSCILKSWLKTKAQLKPGIVATVFNLRTQEAKARRLWALRQPGLHNKVQDNFVYTLRSLCLGGKEQTHYCTSVIPEHLYSQHTGFGHSRIRRLRTDSAT